MDHVYAEERQLADRYLMGKLPDAERRPFEEHFIDCPVCLDRLETIEGLLRALRDLPPGHRA